MLNNLISSDIFKCPNKICNFNECILKKHFDTVLNKEYILNFNGYASKKIYELAIENPRPSNRKKLVNTIKEILKNENKSEFLFLDGNKDVLIISSHSVLHYRYLASIKSKRKLNDWLKIPDKNTGLIACYLHKKLNLPTLIQIYTAWLDPNFYREALLREKLRELLKNRKIKLVLDIHGLSDDRDADFDIIDLYGLSLLPYNAIYLRNSLKLRLEKAGYNVGVNRYFNGGLMSQIQYTIVKEVSQELNTPCIELEINKKFRNIPNKIIDEKILNILVNWLENDVLLTY